MCKDPFYYYHLDQSFPVLYEPCTVQCAALYCSVLHTVLFCSVLFTVLRTVRYFTEVGRWHLRFSSIIALLFFPLGKSCRFEIGVSMVHDILWFKVLTTQTFGPFMLG